MKIPPRNTIEDHHHPGAFLEQTGYAVSCGRKLVALEACNDQILLGKLGRVIRCRDLCLDVRNGCIGIGDGQAVLPDGLKMRATRHDRHVDLVSQRRGDLCRECAAERPGAIYADIPECHGLFPCVYVDMNVGNYGTPRDGRNAQLTLGGEKLFPVNVMMQPAVTRCGGVHQSLQLPPPASSRH